MANSIINLCKKYFHIGIYKKKAYNRSENKRGSKLKPSQVDRNFEIFQQRLPDLLATQANKYALMHDGDIVAFYDTWEDAFTTGDIFYGENAYSIQKVTTAPVDLGYFSHAINHR